MYAVVERSVSAYVGKRDPSKADVLMATNYGVSWEVEGDNGCGSRLVQELNGE